MTVMKLTLDKIYHIHLPNPKPVLFSQESDFATFMSDYTRLIHPLVETYAYCLLPTGFHFFLRFLSLKEQVEAWYFDDEAELTPFELMEPQKRWEMLMAQGDIADWRAVSPVDDVDCGRVVRYIHHLPVKHGLVEEQAAWKWSSYKALVGQKRTLLARPALLHWFHSTELMISAHEEPLDESKIGYLI